jgi:hypothetical protein
MAHALPGSVRSALEPFAQLLEVLLQLLTVLLPAHAIDACCGTRVQCLVGGRRDHIAGAGCTGRRTPERDDTSFAELRACQQSVQGPPLSLDGTSGSVCPSRAK